MTKYPIHNMQDRRECEAVLDTILRAGDHALRRANWSCEAGGSSSWLLVEAESDADARLMALRYSALGRAEPLVRQV
jgi:hypothetical protein